MNDELFDWDDANVLHIAEHEVDPEEAEEVVLGEPIDAGFDVVNGEERWSYVGETLEGRILRVVLTLRGPRMRVVTAFEPSPLARQLYLQRKAGGK
jgi:hypothetical protein